MTQLPVTPYRCTQEQEVPHVPESNRLTRRQALRKGAIVGGNLLWIAPAIQTLMPRAMAHETSGTFTCCQCRASGNDRRAFTGVADSTACSNLCTSQGTGWSMQFFHRDSTAFQIAGSNATNTGRCSHPDHPQ